MTQIFLFPYMAIMLMMAGPVKAQEPKTPLFDLHTADGATVTGPLAQLGDDWSGTLQAPGSITAKGTDVVSLRRSQAVLPAFPREEQVILANGDRILGAVHQVVGERLRLQAQI